MKANSFIAWLTLLTALTISGVAIYYSVSGLAAIFSAAVIPIIIMGGVLEVSKLVTAVWLHRFWGIATWWLKTYLSIAVLVLMLITSIGIFGFLSKAHDTASGNATEAIATVTRIDGQIDREENRIDILEDRINGLQSGDGFDVSSSIEQQQEIIAGARGAVQADIDYNQTQITAINERLDRDLEALETSRSADIQVQTNKVISLDDLVASYSGQEDTGFINRTDNRGEAERVREEQRPDREAIAAEIQRIDEVARNRESELRREASVAVREAQGNINDYRSQTQDTVDAATAEINRLREQSNSSQDDDLIQIDEWNLTIDGIYTTIDGLKDEKFESEQAVRLVESEVGPIRYIAEFFTGTEDADASLLETAVSWLIMVIIFVFDPLAVLLLIASQYTFEQRRKERFPEGEPELKKPVDSSPYSHNRQTINKPKEDAPVAPEPEEHQGFDSQPFGTDYPYLNFKKIEPSIEEAREAFAEWERAEQQRVHDEEVSAKKDHVDEHVPEPAPEPTLEEAKEALESWETSLPEPIPEVIIVETPFSMLEETTPIEEVTVDTEIKEISADSTEIITSGVTIEQLVEPEGDYMLDEEGRSIHKDALKSLHPELFLQIGKESKSETSFGTTFPKFATKGDIFVRVDANPNRVYKFEGTQWLEVQKEQSDSYLYNEEYLKHLVAKIETGEYDVDLLSDPEKQQIEEYLNSLK